LIGNLCCTQQIFFNALEFLCCFKSNQGEVHATSLFCAVSEQSAGGHLGMHLGSSSLGQDSLQKILSLFLAHFSWQASWWHIAGNEHTKFKSLSHFAEDVIFLNSIYIETGQYDI
jgi:hypothetical protein